MTQTAHETLSKDTRYELLMEQRRRETLRALVAEGDAMTVTALATEIAARETDTLPSNVDEDTCRRVAITLIHRHLPKLAESDVVRFDRESNTVTVGATIDALDLSI